MRLVRKLVMVVGLGEEEVWFSRLRGGRLEGFSIKPLLIEYKHYENPSKVGDRQDRQQSLPFAP